MAAGSQGDTQILPFRNIGRYMSVRSGRSSRGTHSIWDSLAVPGLRAPPSKPGTRRLSSYPSPQRNVSGRNQHAAGLRWGISPDIERCPTGEQHVEGGWVLRVILEYCTLEVLHRVCLPIQVVFVPEIAQKWGIPAVQGPHAFASNRGINRRPFYLSL